MFPQETVICVCEVTQALGVGEKFRDEESPRGSRQMMGELVKTLNHRLLTNNSGHEEEVLLHYRGDYSHECRHVGVTGGGICLVSEK